MLLPRSNFPGPLTALSIKYRETEERIEIQADDINACLDQLRALRVDLTEMTVRSPNLEDVFLELTGRQLRE